MSALDRVVISPEVREAIQASLPQGEMIRHLVPTWSWINSQIKPYEYFLAVTDSLVSTRGLQWKWDLTDEQQRVKQKFEERSVLSQGFKLARKTSKYLFSIEGVTAEDSQDSAGMHYLKSFYGPLNIQWLPQILWSHDMAMTDFTPMSYSERVRSEGEVQRFAGRGHQTELVAEIVSSSIGYQGIMMSFFGDLHDIYNFVMDRKIHGSTSSGSVNRTTKCENCGSTELTIRGSHLVCDYCQSKFAR